MKRRTIAAALLAFSLALNLCACGAPKSGVQEDDGVITVAATTYPIYKLAKIATDGRDNFEVKLIVDQQISCLHDYTLSVKDMRVIESADVILMNGVDFEEFMDDVLRSISVPVVDCSAGIALLPGEGHEDHDAEAHDHGDHDHGHYDPHIWLDPEKMEQMLDNIARALAALDDTLDPAAQTASATAALQERTAFWSARFDALPAEQKYLITFHDGFSYLADAFGLTILKAIEEEAGSEASAKDIVEIVELIEAYDIPMIFVEENGSDATAKAIQRETGVEIGTLSMLMSETDRDFFDSIDHNMQVIYEGLSGSEVKYDEK